MPTWKGGVLTLADFKKDEPVIYLPIHSAGDVSHPDAERGVVSSVGTRYVFVRFDGGRAVKACDPSDLLKAK